MKIIANFKRKIKSVRNVLSSFEFLISLIIIAASLSSFLVGRHSGNGISQNQIVFKQVPQNPLKKIEKNTTGSTNVGIKDSGSIIFGSKSGTKYYYSWCSGASRVKLENRVYYSSEESAKSAGRTIASGCSK